MVAAVLALLGVLDAAYLTLSRYAGAALLVCPTRGGCATVQSSRWSTVPPGNGVPIAMIGVAGYGVLLALALATLHRDTVGPIALPPLLLALAGGAVLVSAVLTALQVLIIQAVCAWCLGSAALTLALWAVATADWRGWRRARSEYLGLGDRAQRHNGEDRRHGWE